MSVQYGAISVVYAAAGACPQKEAWSAGSAERLHQDRVGKCKKEHAELAPKSRFHQAQGRHQIVREQPHKHSSTAEYKNSEYWLALHGQLL